MKKWILLLAFLPIIEILLLIYGGQQLGFWWTISLLVGTGVLGVFLIRKQGVRTWQRVEEELKTGTPPGYALLDGFILFLSGMLLMFPGFITDFLGILFLFPFVRRSLSQYIIKRLYIKMKNGRVIIFK